MRPFPLAHRHVQLFVLVSTHSATLCERMAQSGCLIIVDRVSRTPRFCINNAESTKIDQDALVYVPPLNPLSKASVIGDTSGYVTDGERLVFLFDAPVVQGVPHAVRYKVLKACNNELVANIYFNYGLVTFQFNNIKPQHKAIVIAFGIRKALTAQETSIMKMEHMLPDISYYINVQSLDLVAYENLAGQNSYQTSTKKIVGTKQSMIYKQMEVVRLRGVIQSPCNHKYVFAVMDALRENKVMLFANCDSQSAAVEFTDARGVYQFSATGLVSREVNTDVFCKTTKFGTIRRQDNCVTILENKLKASKHLGEKINGTKIGKGFTITDAQGRDLGNLSSETFTMRIELNRSLPKETKMIILTYAVKMAYKVFNLQALPTPASALIQTLSCGCAYHSPGNPDLMSCVQYNLTGLDLLTAYRNFKRVLIRPAGVHAKTDTKYYDLLDFDMQCFTSLEFNWGPRAMGVIRATTAYGIDTFTINHIFMKNRVYVNDSNDSSLFGYLSHNCFYSATHEPLMHMTEVNDRRPPGKIYKVYSNTTETGKPNKLASIFPYQSTLGVEMKETLNPLWRVLIMAAAMKLFFTSYTFDDIPVPRIEGRYSAWQGGFIGTDADCHNPSPCPYHL